MLESLLVLLKRYWCDVGQKDELPREPTRDELYYMGESTLTDVGGFLLLNVSTCDIYHP